MSQTVKGRSGCCGVRTMTYETMCRQAHNLEVAGSNPAPATNVDKNPGTLAVPGFSIWTPVSVPLPGVFRFVEFSYPEPRFPIILFKRGVLYLSKSCYFLCPPQYQLPISLDMHRVRARQNAAIEITLKSQGRQEPANPREETHAHLRQHRF